MDQINIPTFFVCPISLDIMRDPVTVTTGITYDRESIERWIFSNKSRTCPVTKQPLLSSELTPNHTLRRLIQAWCTTNAAYGVERIPTPKPPVDKAKIAALLEEARRSSPQEMVSHLHKFKAIAMESDRNKRCMEAAGVASFLAFVVKNSYKSMEDESLKAGDEAIAILSSLQVTEEGLKELITKDHPDLLVTITKVLRQGSYQSRAYATFLLKSMLEVLDPVQLIGMKAEIFVDIVHLIKDQISNQTTKAAFQILIELCPWGRNRIKAVDAEAVSLLVELLLDAPERRVCEMALMVLDLLCGCAEGRAELLRHAAGLAVVSKKVLRVSTVATERAVRILSSIARFSATAAVVNEMLQAGVVTKLCFVLQVEYCSPKAKEKAREILILHSRTWKSSPCVPPNLLASYPVLH